MGKNELTTQRYWNQTYQKTKFTFPEKNSKIIQFLERHIPAGSGNRQCMEIGCFPCGFLAYMGKIKKYKVNGIDYCEGINDKLFEWLRSHKIDVGKIMKNDFFEYTPNAEEKYDLVYSLGFIEHFSDYENVIKRHESYVKKGGMLIITAPNCRGRIQYLIRKIFYPDCYKTHNINSMYPEKWKKILEQDGYQVKFAGYFGGFAVWRNESIPLTGFKKQMWPILNEFFQYLSRKKIPDSPSYSPFCGIVAIKK